MHTFMTLMQVRQLQGACQQAITVAVFLAMASLGLSSSRQVTQVVKTNCKSDSLHVFAGEVCPKTLQKHY